MSLSMPSRRLLRGGPALAASATTTSLLPALQSLSLGPSTAPSARAIHTTPSNQWFWSRKKKETSLESQVTGTAESRKALVERLSSRIEGPAIFGDEAQETGGPAGDSLGSGPPRKRQGTFTKAGASLVKEHLARATDPDPRSRVRWERKMVIRQVQRGTNPYSKEPRAERIARTERALTSRSTFLPTSVKKLVHLAHQIQGKTVAEALVQMRFSKKKMAQEVKYQLELARDMAIAERGMGLGETQRAAEVAAGAVEGTAVKDVESIKIQDKDGKWVRIDDPTRMYIAEAWVNRGPLRGRRPDYRARGRVFIKEKPSTSISIVLKEEKTRMREHADRVAKKLRQGPWVHLPDRPVPSQRPYYSW
ncbi:ribosomal protein L22 [Trichocladium antarcticum]|uniref:Ribosomal protein L22 n=1 Tax=Trichocladium antarcticum TaxID=1450529 RepID=A0AAN6ZD45_9PEZI|nr:ribosomal protein L22 [Trichocladium antarcticum]